MKLVLHGAMREIEASGDLFVGKTLRGQLGDLKLPACQGGPGAVQCSGPPRIPDFGLVSPGAAGVDGSEQGRVIAFHRFLIGTAIIFCAVFALWAIVAYRADGSVDETAVWDAVNTIVEPEGASNGTFWQATV